MRRSFKRVLSIVVVMAMVMSGFAIVPVTASAEESFPAQFDLRDRLVFSR